VPLSTVAVLAALEVVASNQPRKPAAHLRAPGAAAQYAFVMNVRDGPPRATVYQDWALLECGPEAMSLVIRWLADDRGLGKARVVVQELGNCISIAVKRAVRADERDSRGRRVVYTTMRSTPIEHVALNSAVRGRRVGGAGMSERAVGSFSYLSVPGPGTLLFPALPSVLGLAVEDAVQVLDLRGFPVVIEGDGGEVVAQRPSRGQVARNRQAPGCDTGQSVTLVTG
jgi:hypothetical protein